MGRFGSQGHLSGPNGDIASGLPVTRAQSPKLMDCPCLFVLTVVNYTG